jgi:hypothetical protein
MSFIECVFIKKLKSGQVYNWIVHSSVQTTSNFDLQDKLQRKNIKHVPQKWQTYNEQKSHITSYLHIKSITRCNICVFYMKDYIKNKLIFKKNYLVFYFINTTYDDAYKWRYIYLQIFNYIEFLAQRLNSSKWILPNCRNTCICAAVR